MLPDDEEVGLCHLSCFMFTHRCDSAHLGQERVTDQRPTQTGGNLDLGGQFERPEEESAALRQGQERSRCGCKAQEETGLSGRNRDQNQDPDWVHKTKTSTDEEEVNYNREAIENLCIYYFVYSLLGL